jgi:Fuc2NAc and GlcNAc transferase
VIAIALSLVCFVASAGLTWTARAAAVHLNMLDSPNGRSSHVHVTPRGGGSAIVLTFYVGVIGLMLTHRMSPALAAVFAPGLAVALVGWLDDRRGVGTVSRFVVHVAAAAAAVVALNRLAPASGTPLAVLILQTLAVAAAINFYNFMDGIDGIAGVEAVSIGTVGWALLVIRGMSASAPLPLAALSLAAASAGFLVWNWPPARIFMGDVGSGFLGYAFAMLALSAAETARTPLAAWIVLGGVFAVDATFTLFRRMMRGERWFAAHRSHAYQRASRHFQSHRAVTVVVLTINLVLGAFGAIIVANPATTAMAVAMALILLVTTYLFVERQHPMFDADLR